MPTAVSFVAEKLAQWACSLDCAATAILPLQVAADKLQPIALAAPAPVPVSATAPSAAPAAITTLTAIHAHVLQCCVSSRMFSAGTRFAREREVLAVDPSRAPLNSIDFLNYFFNLGVW